MVNRIKQLDKVNRAQVFELTNEIFEYSTSDKVFRDQFKRICGIVSQYFTIELMNKYEKDYFNKYIYPVTSVSKYFDIKSAIFFIPLLSLHDSKFETKAYKNLYIYMLESDNWLDKIKENLDITTKFIINDYTSNNTFIEKAEGVNEQDLSDELINTSKIVSILYSKFKNFIIYKEEFELSKKVRKLIGVIDKFPLDKQKQIIKKLEDEVKEQKNKIICENKKIDDVNIRFERKLNLIDIDVYETLNDYDVKEANIDNDKSLLAENFRHFYKDEVK